MKKALHWCMIVVFAAMLIVPLVTSDFVGGQVSVAENRYKALAPKFRNEDGTVNSLNAIKLQLENWLDDNVGIRDLSNRVRTKLNYYAFNNSSKTDTFIGKNGWMYYYNNDILADFQGKNLLTDEQLDFAADQLALYQDYLMEHGSKLLAVLLPDKKTIYPENYPSGVIPASGQTRSHQLEQYFEQNTTLPFMYIDEILFEKKAEGYDVYPPAYDNAHWNDVGAYWGYVAMVEKLNELYEVGIPVIPEEDFVVTAQDRSFIFNDAVNLSEPVYSIHHKNSEILTLDNTLFDALPMLRYNGNPDTYKRHYVNRDQSLPRLLYIGDSYSVFLFQSLPCSFSDTTFVHVSDIKWLPQILEVTDPDYVIFESVERMISSFEDCYCYYAECASIIFVDQMSPDKLEMIPVADYDGDYFSISSFQGTAVLNNVAYLPWSNGEISFNGWAIDPLRNTSADLVLVQVGEKIYCADCHLLNYGVVALFNENWAYNYAGYEITVPAEMLYQAGSFTVHLLCDNAQYRYPPITYQVVYDGPPSEANVTYLSWTATPYHFLDFANGLSCGNEAVLIEPQQEQTQLMGWAVDPLAGRSAYGVELHVGDQTIFAPCEDERSAVAEAFQSSDYLRSGYVCYVSNDLLADEDEVTFVVIAADGVNAYEPVTLPVRQADE